MANIIEKLGKKTLIICPNKTLAGQLYSELKSFFPNNRVEYFISYYDYYQPEAYVATTDTYINKDASINDEIDQLRHSATASLLTNDDVIVVASVSCIYGIGDIEEYKNQTIFLRKNDIIDRDKLIEKLISLNYERNQLELKRGIFRVRGDFLDIIPVNEYENGIRISFFDNEIEDIAYFNITTGNIVLKTNFTTIFPASLYVTSYEKLQIAIDRIKQELEERVSYFEKNNKLLEAQRIKQITNYDIEMLKETGFCTGVENYSRHLNLKKEGETPNCLIDFFKDDFLLVIDESHVTIPQVGGMYMGDRARKQNLVDFGFRLPSCLDNRPLKFKEFESKFSKVIYMSATPGKYEKENNFYTVEQIIRPTYLLDPEVEVRSKKDQINNLYQEILKRIEKNQRVLITTLTIKMSELLTQFLKEKNIKVAYIHSKIKAMERLKIIRDLRIKKYDCLVGINLLREGLDIPEVSLVCILDADMQGFLRSESSLIQTIGRAARNKEGKVIMYADTITPQMENAIFETNRRRQIQIDYNLKNNTFPTDIKKEIQSEISLYDDIFDKDVSYDNISKKDLEKEIKKIEDKMKKAAKELDFEAAAKLRDLLFEMKGMKS